MKEKIEPVLGLGEPIHDNFTGDAWLAMLSARPEYDCSIYNVTFAPSARNYWHTHSVGQILLCTEGIGYYQQKGEPAQRLTKGTVIDIPANSIHWHGAAPDSYFTHIGITPRAEQNSVAWLYEVTDKEYQQSTKNYKNE